MSYVQSMSYVQCQKNLEKDRDSIDHGIDLAISRNNHRIVRVSPCTQARKKLRFLGCNICPIDAIELTIFKSKSTISRSVRARVQ